eukprot:scaffold295425_cov32-Tisochrysis_lutea.AAC.1
MEHGAPEAPQMSSSRRAHRVRARVVWRSVFGSARARLVQRAHVRSGRMSRQRHRPPSSLLARRWVPSPRAGSSGAAVQAKTMKLSPAQLAALGRSAGTAGSPGSEPIGARRPKPFVSLDLAQNECVGQKHSSLRGAPRLERRRPICGGTSSRQKSLGRSTHRARPRALLLRTPYVSCDVTPCGREIQPEGTPTP